MRVQYYDINIVKYGHDYRVTYLRRSVSDRLRLYDDVDDGIGVEYDKIGDRFASSVSRAKNAILGYGKCNEWDYFVTFTLDPRKYDRYDLGRWRKDFSQYIRDRRKQNGYDLRYLLIPERHKDGAWHMHGLMGGIPWDDLTKFDILKHPSKLVQGGYRYWQGITDKFGFNSFGKLRNRDAASAYCLKYAGKGFALQDMDAGTHLYYVSQGLNKPERILDSQVSCYLTTPDFANEFCAISWINETEYQRIIDYLR
ncbi:Uncharacterised protein [uncultured Eubacterium sp.]|nr:Uncharacterised protein [uncultured Eubacterium sp.]